MTRETSRPEIAFILLLLQSTFWAMAGVAALPFVLAGEVYMLLLGVVSIAFATVACMLAVAVVRRRRRARRLVLILEWVCLGGSLLQLVLPLGANRGPVALMVNVAIPLGVILLLRGKAMRSHFGISAAPAR